MNYGKHESVRTTKQSVNHPGKQPTNKPNLKCLHISDSIDYEFNTFVIINEVFLFSLFTDDFTFTDQKRRNKKKSTAAFLRKYFESSTIQTSACYSISIHAPQLSKMNRIASVEPKITHKIRLKIQRKKKIKYPNPSKSKHENTHESTSEHEYYAVKL